jgi:2-oxo-4-hydroxy-4-carboxy--5-ureidoimidazoline (OHCU) decarboxylase
LARLAHLNSCYERRYPGLRYITFVNGRSRAVVAEEMEVVLQVGHSLSPDEPPVNSFEPVDKNSAAWRSELDRAIVDMGRIAESRLAALGVE